MGRLTTVSTNRIIPSQDFLKENTIKYILKCILNGEKNKLPPAPIVRIDPNSKKYVAVDGHNLIAIYDLLDREIEVYVADSAGDRVAGMSNMSGRNFDLVEKYNRVIKDADRISNKGISSFSDLRKKYGYLESIVSAKRHLNLK